MTDDNTEDLGFAHLSVVRLEIYEMTRRAKNAAWIAAIAATVAALTTGFMAWLAFAGPLS